MQAVDETLAHLHRSEHSRRGTSKTEIPAAFPGAPKFEHDVLGAIYAGKGDELPVSAFPCDGTFPTGTAKWEKRNLALEIPAWDSKICIQCGKCAMVCPHAVIRIKVYDSKELEGAPKTFKSCDARDKEWAGHEVHDPGRPRRLHRMRRLRRYLPCEEQERRRGSRPSTWCRSPRCAHQRRENWDFFLKVPELDRRKIKIGTIRQQQMQEPLFEFSGACSGCGETPYLKLVSQLFGDRAVVANATGCSSIYGGNLPTTLGARTPTDAARHGRTLYSKTTPSSAWDSASPSISRPNLPSELVRRMAGTIGDELVTAMLTRQQKDEADIYEQRQRVDLLKESWQTSTHPDAKQLLSVADMLVKKSVWIMGGDGWAYDIGYGGLDHVLASGRNVNVLVLDTEVYSNTGGQASKSTPRGAVAKFAAGGKPGPKKDLG